MTSYDEYSVVVQGPLSGTGCDVQSLTARLRTLLPGATLIYSGHLPKPSGLDLSRFFDVQTWSDDPGGLPSLKISEPKSLNNGNRQITGTRAGLERVSTPYAVKLRSDCSLESTTAFGIFETLRDKGDSPKRIGRSRILVPSFYTINPRYQERMLFHVSDWFQIGATDDLLAYWSCPPIDMETATWYETRPHAAGSYRSERQFRARYAVEQWMALHYLRRQSPIDLRYHNFMTGELLDEFEEYLVDNFIVAHPIDLGIAFPKYQSLYRIPAPNAFCYSHRDWAHAALRLRKLASPYVDAFHVWRPESSVRKLYTLAIETGVYKFASMIKRKFCRSKAR